MKMKPKYLLFISIALLAGLYLHSQRVQSVNSYDEIKWDDAPLKIMTFNIRGARGQGGLERIAEEIRAEDPDIVALQEIDYRLPRSGYQNQTKELAELLQMNYLFSPNLNLLIGSYGNSILSKYPITEYERYWIAGFPERRGIIAAKIRVGISTITVYNTHLSLQEEEREYQLRKLSALLENHIEPTVLVGDFNTLPEDPQLSSLRDVLHDPLFHHNIRIPTLLPQTQNRQIDYIMLSPHFVFMQAVSQPSEISDHAAVTYQIKLNRHHMVDKRNGAVD